ncbi:MAG: tryptophan 7-halogenase [Ilumatobacteraceae bacterium]
MSDEPDSSRHRSSRCERFDVVVAGGGPAGSATAIHLARGGCRVLLVERDDFTRMRMGETLPPAVNPLLAELGVLDDLPALGHVPSYETASAWGGEEVADRSFVFSPYGHGWHVDRAAFDALLVDRAAAAGVDVHRGDVQAPRRAGSGGVVIDVGLTTVAAGHLVDATGRAARLARRLGASARRFDSLVSASVVCALPPGSAAGDTFLEAIADGWWYASPLPGDRRLVALFTDAPIAAALRLRTPSGWWAALQRAPRTLALAAAGTPTAAPRLTSCAGHVLAPAATPWCTVVGDAALAVDPLSSSGVSFALRSARRAAAAIVAGGTGEDDGYDAFVGGSAVAYERERAEHYALERRWPASEFWHRRQLHRPVTQLLLASPG